MTLPDLYRERHPSPVGSIDLEDHSRLTVCVKESESDAWQETTEIISVSRTGAGFTLRRPCTPGRLILLQTSLQRELRSYDFDAKVYLVIGLVQFCNATKVDGSELYNVGVGFIGNKTPESFKKNPRQSYRITGARPDGLWQIKEVDLTFKDRKHPRYRVNIPVQITVLNQSERSLVSERSLTVNVGIGGASVLTTAAGNVGDKVKFACGLLDFYSMAVIRGLRESESGPGTLHLQFLDGEFPVNRMLTGQIQSPNNDEQFFYR